MAEPFVGPGFEKVTPILSVSDAHAQIKFLEDAFGATLRYKMEDDKGQIMHAEVVLYGQAIMLGQPEDESARHPSSLHLYVEKCDEVYDRAVKAGGSGERPPEDMFYGDRSSLVTDPQGNHWWISTHVEEVTPEEIERRLQEMAK